MPAGSFNASISSKIVINSIHASCISLNSSLVIIFLFSFLQFFWDDSEFYCEYIIYLPDRYAWQTDRIFIYYNNNKIFIAVVWRKKDCIR
jgi:hypothetical protein